MKQINVYVQQKYVDLNVISAYQALTIFLKKIKCTKLQRFVNWTITVDSEKNDDEIIQKLTQGSFLLCNPNKENILTSLDIDQEDAVYLNIKDKLQVHNNHLKNQLTKLSNLSVEAIEKSVIWSCYIDELDHNLRKEYVKQEILGIKGVQSGLLLNPIYETYTFLN